MNLFLLNFFILNIVSIYSFQQPMNYYYKLALQNWCSKNYYIHGLWLDYTTIPSHINSLYPTNCYGPDYNISINNNNEELQRNLKRTWYDCSDLQSETLYQHEWINHGKCAYMYSNVSQIEYFSITISLYDLLNSSDRNTGMGGCYDLHFTRIDCPSSKKFLY